MTCDVPGGAVNPTKLHLYILEKFSEYLEFILQSISVLHWLVSWLITPCLEKSSTLHLAPQVC